MDHDINGLADQRGIKFSVSLERAIFFKGSDASFSKTTVKKEGRRKNAFRSAIIYGKSRVYSRDVDGMDAKNEWFQFPRDVKEMGLPGDRFRLLFTVVKRFE